jgi:hypothetical protein
MSIEKTISDLTAAVTALTAALNQRAGATTVAQPTAVSPQAAMAAAAAAAMNPQAAMAAAAAMAPQIVQQMPTLPTFAAPAPAAPAAGPAPFADGPGLIAYVMGAYKDMGPTKGAQIQGVLTQLGYQNINDVKPEHYGSLYQGVEALKRS